LSILIVTPSNTILGCSSRLFAVDVFARGLHTGTAVARLPLLQLAFPVLYAVNRISRTKTAQETLDNRACKLLNIVICDSLITSGDIRSTREIQ